MGAVARGPLPPAWVAHSALTFVARALDRGRVSVCQRIRACGVGEALEEVADHWRLRRGRGERLDGAATGRTLGERTRGRAGREGGEDQSVHRNRGDAGGDE